jgi:Ca2+-binding EF-hand superfamily protein
MPRSELRENFDHFDADDNGKIEFDEFRSLLAALDADVGEEEARIGFDAVDSDGDGHIEFGEFLSWWDAR